VNEDGGEMMFMKRRSILVALMGVIVAASVATPPSAEARVRNAGLNVTVINYPNLGGDQWESLRPWARNDGATLCKRDVITSLDFSWGTGPVMGCQSEDVVLHITGFITAPSSGRYIFSNRSDDGFILKINSRTVISNWKEQPPSFYNDSGSVSLVARRKYKIEVWYYENSDGADLELYVRSRRGDEIVPSSWLTTR